MAGGNPCNIFQVHSVGIYQVNIKLWMVIHAINQCNELKIEFPKDHLKQQEIAHGFQQMSSVLLPVVSDAWTEC